MNKRLIERSENEYWDRVVNKILKSEFESLWRHHMRWSYEELLNGSAKKSTDGIVLKTDLFDEAINVYTVFPLLKRTFKTAVGIDISHEVAKKAKSNIRKELKCPGNIVLSDVRNLPFKSNSIDFVFSNSTLDHFNEKKDIYNSLREIFRVLRPNGILLVTLDNPNNPIISLRNFLPHQLMIRFGIIPYQMGVTLPLSELVDSLKFIGFHVQYKTVITHSPRIIAIWAGDILNRIGNKTLITIYFKILRLFENLQKLPLREFTGYFIAVKAMKK